MIRIITDIKHLGVIEHEYSRDQFQEEPNFANLGAE